MLMNELYTIILKIKSGQYKKNIRRGLLDNFMKKKLINLSLVTYYYNLALSETVS